MADGFTEDASGTFYSPFEITISHPKRSWRRRHFLSKGNTHDEANTEQKVTAMAYDDTDLLAVPLDEIVSTASLPVASNDELKTQTLSTLEVNSDCVVWVNFID